MGSMADIAAIEIFNHQQKIKNMSKEESEAQFKKMLALKNVSKEEIDFMGKKLLRPLRYVLIIASFFWVASFFVAIWYDWILALKIFGTSLIILIVSKKIKDIAEDTIREEIAKEKTEPKIGKKSKFQERLAEMQRLRDEQN